MNKTKPCFAANKTEPVADKTQTLEIDGCKVTINYAKSGSANILPHISRTLLETAAQNRPVNNLPDS